MGLLRKLAELVVEFPEQKTAAKGAPEDDEQDVVKAIEKVRAELEADLKPKFSAPAPVEESKAPPAAKDSPGLPPSTDNIPLLKVLSISQIYETAKLAPAPDGFDVFKVEALLNDPEMADLALDIRARMVKMTLKGMGRELKDVLADAARRDSALDQYQDFLRQTVEDVSRRVAEANARHKLEMEEFIAAKNRAIEANLARLAAAQQAQADFERSKRIEEERLFSTVAPFVAAGQNPVQVSGADRPATPPDAAGKHKEDSGK